MSTVEAMASGLVVFLPRYMRPNFDDGAVYAEPGSSAGEDPRVLAGPRAAAGKQRRRAREVVMERYSAESFSGRLSSLVAKGKNALHERGVS